MHGSPYTRLVELCERESELIAASAWDDISALADERARLVALLPARPPHDARPLLERASRLIQANAAAIDAARTETLEQLKQLRTVRAAIRAYAGGDAAVFVDTRR
jgi:hypothetical protein